LFLIHCRIPSYFEGELNAYRVLVRGHLDGLGVVESLLEIISQRNKMRECGLDLSGAG